MQDVMENTGKIKLGKIVAGLDYDSAQNAIGD